MTDPRTQVFRLTNRERVGHNVRTLKRSRLLDRSARRKARRLARSGELEHGIWWTLIWKITGRRYGTIGENIAEGQNDPDTVMRQWMNSTAHRANILKPGYTHLGVGYIRTRAGVEYWVQHFGGRK